MKQTRNDILQSAIQLFVSEGISTPTARIAKNAGVSNGTLFNHFETKQILIDEIYRHVKMRIVTACTDRFKDGQDIKTNLTYSWHDYIMWAMDNMEAHRACALLKSSNLVSPTCSEEIEKLFAPFLMQFVTAQEQKILRMMDIEYLCHIYYAQMLTAIDYAVAHQLQGEDLENHIATGFDICWRSIENIQD